MITQYFNTCKFKEENNRWVILPLLRTATAGFPEDAKKLGIHVIPMPFFINEKIYFEDIDFSQERFYQVLAEDEDVSTSQPSPGEVMDLWDDLLRRYSEIVYIPMSSGLSASCETAQGLAQEYEGKVQVVDNKRISVTMKQAVLDARKLAAEGENFQEIKEILEHEALESSIYLMVDTLKYLKKGGRITPAAAMIGSALNLKPILQIQGAKLDAYKKVRGVKAAKKNMLEAMKNDLEDRFAGYVQKGEMKLYVAYSGSGEEVAQWSEEVNAAFPDLPVADAEPVSLSVACHTGPGVLAIAAAHCLD